MSAADLLDELDGLDVKLWREGESLKFDAPTGALDTHLRERIKELKPELLRILAAPPTDESGLSLGQKRIWFHEKILAGGGSYQIPGAMKIDGPLDINALESAFSALINRHDALRFAVIEKDGKPLASYVDQPSFKLELIELAGPDVTPSGLEKILQDFLAEPFNMDVAPLMKCRVYRLASQVHILVISLHHIISDGWSVALFVDNLVEEYRSFHCGGSPELPTVELGYRDYVQATNVSLYEQKNSFEKFWRSYLRGAPLQFDFPSDRNRPPVENDAGNEISLQLDPQLMQRLSSLARESECTLFTLLLSAFSTLLHRLSGQDDLVIGTAHAGRNDPAYHTVIGLFANTFPIRCKPNSETTFRDFLIDTKEQVLKALEHSDTPFDWIVNAVNPPRDLSRPPVYQVMFNFLNQPKADPALPDCELKMLPLENTSSKVDLTLAVEERDGEYTAGIEYKTDLFDEERIRALLGHFSVLLESIATDQGSRLCELEIMSSSEQGTSLVDWNDTSRDFDRTQTLISILQHGDAEDRAAAYAFGGVSLSYGDLRSQSLQISSQLISKGIHGGMIVAVMLERGLEYPAAVFGILQSGAAFLPIAPDCPPDRLDFILADSGAEILIVSREAELESKSNIVCIEELFTPQQAESKIELPKISPDQLAYCVYTSGTTGKPKGVEITHASALNLLNALIIYPGVPKGCSMLGIAPFYFDMSIPDIFLPIFSGGTGIILDETESRSPERLNAIIEECENPVMQATASTLRMLLAQDWIVPSRLRIWCGGEAFPADLAEQLLGKCADLVNIYGPTETTVWSAAHRLSKVENPLPVGAPLQNTRVYVLDEKLNPLPVGYPGQLHIAGDGLARGYRNNSSLTDEKFHSHSLPCVGEERLYATGDLARWRSDGNLELLGRIDSQLKILGHRVEAGEIESVLTGCASIDEAAVSTARDSSGELQLVAFIVCQSSIDQEWIRTELRKKLPPYMEPRWICEIDSLPRSANGKLDRKALPEPRVEENPPGEGDDSMSSVEKQMHGLWVKILQQDSIGKEQNFFEVGGHSLLAVHLLAEVKKIFGSSVSVVSFLHEPTIAGLCCGLSQVESTGARLVELSQVKAPSSLLLVPGASGNPYSYYAIAEHLDPDVRLVAIAPADVPEGSAPTIEKVAEEYVDLLKKSALEAPYHLVGHSYGGSVVFEMAHQLLESSDSVGSLILIDLPAKPNLKSEDSINDAQLLGEIAEAAQVFSGMKVDAKVDFSGMETEKAKSLLLTILEKAGMIPSQDDTSLSDTLLSRYRNSREAMQSYVPNLINVPIHVIRCAESEFDSALPDSLGWDEFTSAGVSTATVPGTHISMITGSHAAPLAGELLKIVRSSI